jgi:hypothetical protein
MINALRWPLLMGLLSGLVWLKMPVDLARLWVAVWNVGHVILFWLLMQTLLAWRATRRPLTLRWVFFCWCALLAGGALIEWMQTWIGRDGEWGDIRADGAGALLGALFSRHWPLRPSQPLRRGWRGARYLLGGFLLVASARDVWLHALDRWMRWQAFPVLYSAESPLATWARLDRLNVLVETVRLPALASHALLQVDLKPGRYSTLSIDELQSDWRGHKALVWRWYNPDIPMEISCRAHDQQHVRNAYPDDDRYSQRFLLASGWNELTIPLDHLREAPVTREMHLGHMRSVGCFAANLQASKRVFLEKVYLRAD